jgi:hypothetical protein
MKTNGIWELSILYPIELETNKSGNEIKVKLNTHQILGAAVIVSAR